MSGQQEKSRSRARQGQYLHFHDRRPEPERPAVIKLEGERTATRSRARSTSGKARATGSGRGASNWSVFSFQLSVQPSTVLGMNPELCRRVQSDVMRSIFYAVLVLGWLVAPSATQSSIAGDWTLMFNGPQGPIEASAKFTQEGETVSGTIDGPQGAIDVTGTLKETKLAISMTVEGGGQTITVYMLGDVDGDTMKDLELRSGVECLGGEEYRSSKFKVGKFQLQVKGSSGPARAASAELSGLRPRSTRRFTLITIVAKIADSCRASSSSVRASRDSQAGSCDEAQPASRLFRLTQRNFILADEIGVAGRLIRFFEIFDVDGRR